MAALKAQNETIVFDGVGGPLMAAQGLESIKPMEELCVMGIVEVVRHYPRLRRLGFEIIAHIEETQPDVVVTIDLPDFNFAVAKRLKKRGIYKGKIVHYVAPSVWAWRPGRAKKVARFLDGLMCLFPFEPDYFTVHGLRAEFVGHSMVEGGMLDADGGAFRAKYRIAADAMAVGVLFGSRQREVEVHGDVFGDAIGELFYVMKNSQNDWMEEGRREKENEKSGGKRGGLHFVVPTLPKLERRVREVMDMTGVDYTITTEPAEKEAAFAACDSAMAVSGTVGLELAYMGVPHVVAYKAHPLTAFLIKMVVKTKFAHLANILLGREVVPELLQERCTAENIAEALRDLEGQKEGLAEVREMLESAGKPAARAAGFVLDVIPAARSA